MRLKQADGSGCVRDEEEKMAKAKALPFYCTSRHLDRRCSEVALLVSALDKEYYKNHQISSTVGEGLG